MHISTKFGPATFVRCRYISILRNSRWPPSPSLTIVISPYLSEKSSDFHEILYTAADFELDERHVALALNEKVALDRLRVRQNVFLI